MTETQAKSGGSGTSTSPVDGEPKDGANPAGREAAGRAAVPADASSTPKFTRAPGMPPPPGEPGADSNEGSSDGKRPPAPGVAKGSATVPIVTKGKGGTPSGAAGRTTVTPP